MTASTHLHELDLAAQVQAERLLSALHQKGVADHLLGDQPAPTASQVALTLRALADFSLCIRILPRSARRFRSGDPVTGLGRYLAGFAEHLAHHGTRMPYDPRYWVLGEPVTDRLMRAIDTSPTGIDLAGSDTRPSPQQTAATLLALADLPELELPRRMVDVAGDPDLPWTGATGLGLYFWHLADHVVAAGDSGQ